MIDDPLCPEVGVFPIDATRARWRVWACNARRVELVVGSDCVAMEPEEHGFFVCERPTPTPGDRYAYSLDGGPPLPDPASRWQPDGVLAPSAVYFPDRFPWDEGSWKGIARDDLVFYELHVGTFTSEGTFDAIVPRIDALLDLGITAIELMPIAQFPGVRSWGYDGVHPFAVQQSYGGPESLQRLVEACHRKGMAIFLDVVANHFGPEANVFPLFGNYLTEKYKTDWGPALNCDGRHCDPVRSFVLQNARMWLRDYRFDGLRLDAVDQIYDRSPRHILSELVEVAHKEGANLGRSVHIFGETDLNDAPRFLNPLERGGYGFDGQWNDDFHHAVHVVLTGETNGYYQDFADGPRAVAKVFSEGFVNNGNYSPFRGRRHGTNATGIDGNRLVAFTQNHDQVGNRLKSDRYAASLPPSANRLAAGLLLLAPRLPLLFMGQEYGETNPFPFFCDFQSPELIAAVRQGRKAEFAHFGWEDASLPTRSTRSTLRASAILGWSWETPFGRGLRARSCTATCSGFAANHRPCATFSRPRTQLVGHSQIHRGHSRQALSDVDPDALTILFNLDGHAPGDFPEGYDASRATFPLRR